MILRDWQAEGVAVALGALVEAEAEGRFPRVLLVAPTGTGKSYLLLALRELLSRLLGSGVLLSPRVEILAGIGEKGGMETSRKGLEAEGLFTPIRYRNLLRDGKAPDARWLLVDEAHHAPAESWQETLLAHLCQPVVGVTATGFRGTPKETIRLRKVWGRPIVVRTLAEAAEAGDIAIPECQVFPLADDDKVKFTSAGEFEAVASAKLYHDRLGDLVSLLRQAAERQPGPGIIAVPTTQLALDLADVLGPKLAACVVQDTPPAERMEIFGRIRSGDLAFLVNIAVVGEGVDLPELSVFYDCLPTQSPVRWLQALGRITRPKAHRPHYVGFNRNLERHAYLLDGLLPREVVAAAQAAFGGVSKRLGSRALGLEALGKFKPLSVKLANGVLAQGFSVYAIDRMTGQKREYYALASPFDSEVLWATRCYESKTDGTCKYADWERCEPPEGLEGFQTSKRSWALTTGMKQWWANAAAQHGLWPEPPEQARLFDVLPVLCNLGVRVK